MCFTSDNSCVAPHSEMFDQWRNGPAVVVLDEIGGFNVRFHDIRLTGRGDHNHQGALVWGLARALSTAYGNGIIRAWRFEV